MHVHAAPASPSGNGANRDSSDRSATRCGNDRTQSVLRFSLIATLAFVAITFIAGLRAHSLALLSESGHNVSDFLALLLSIAGLLWGVARDVNLRSAFIHMAGDTLSTAAVIAGGAGILVTGHNWIDPILSLIIAALILWSSIGIVRETLNILLEGTPRGIDLTHIRSDMEGVAGVLNVHDLHIWCLGSQSRALACHVTIADIPPSESACILLNLNQVLKDHFDICHSTIQFEHENCTITEGCVVPIEQMSAADPAHHHGHVH